MKCAECGSPCQGKYCSACEVELAAEEYHGVPADDSPDWRDWNDDRHEDGDAE